MTSELVITETTGDKRQVILRGRSLPDISDSPPEFGAVMRGRLNYAPANPVADVSLVGSTWTPTTFAGRWDDKFFRGPNAPEIKGFKDLASRKGFLGGFTNATAALQVVEAMLVLHRGQSLLRVECGPFIRYGILWEFTPTYIRDEIYLWRMEFHWTGDTDVKPPIKKPKRVEARSLLQLLLALLEGLRNLIKVLGLPAKYFAAKIQAPMDALTNAITSCIEELTKVIANAITPAKVLGDLRANLTRIKLAARDLAKAFNRFLADFGEDAPSPRDSALAGVASIAISKEALRIAAVMAEQEYNLAKLDTPDVQASVFTAAGESLRDVAARFYGSAADWLVLAAFNSLPCNPPAGTLVMIPRKA
jgi:hypothetical protein